MVSHHPVKFGGHGHCGSGDVMFLEVKEQDSICLPFHLLLLFISRGHGLKAQGISY